MATKRAGDDSERGSPKMLLGQKGTMIILKRNLTPHLILMKMVGMMMDLVRKWRIPLERLLQTLKKIQRLD